MTDILCADCSRPLPPDAPDSLCPYCLLALVDEPSTQAATASMRSRFVPPDPSELQQHFDRQQLEIVKLVGSGGMGAVYQARQRRLMRDVALKILPPELATSPGFDDRFAREAQVLAKLDHTCIVDVHDFGKAGPYSYLMLEYVDGVNLRDLMLGGMMAPRDAFEIIPQICDALQYAHDSGIVHRDIKPENILIDHRGRVRITDFGLAKLARIDDDGRNLTGTHQVMGTPHYMAPEQIEKPRQVDHRADIYALGVVFYELLTGELPLGRFDPPSRKGNGSRRLDKVVMRTLEKEPDRRYDHASDVKSDVERASGESAPVAGARQAAEFVVDSASSAQESIAQFSLKHPVVQQIALVVCIAGAYIALMLAVLCLAGAILWTPVWLAIAVALSLLVARLSHAGSQPEVLSQLARPQLWIASKVTALPREPEQLRPIVSTPQGRSTLLTSAAFVCFLLAVGCGIGMMEQDDYFPFAASFLLASFGLARYRLSNQSVETLTPRDRWFLYPPIATVLTIVLVPLLIAPAIGVAAILVESSRELRQFLGDEPPRVGDHFITVSFGIAVVLFVLSAWITILTLLARAFRGVVRWICHPFLCDWDGQWALTGAFGGAICAVIFACVASTIALG